MTKLAKLIKTTQEHAERVYAIALEKLQRDRIKHARKIKKGGEKL